ncbi:MAG: chemotaxis protein chel [Rhodospirillaceae bacterium]|nr:chemotaxis protein chel [Rhodospirillaceae bacterium]
MIDAISDPAMMAGTMTDRKITAPQVGENTDRRQIREIAETFEAQFVGQMLGHMYAGIETDGPFGGGFGEEMFRSMMIDEYGKIMTRRGGIGIADAVERELLKMQEVQP